MANATEKSLNHLIDINEDARVFYSEAAERTKDAEMMRLFRQMADIHYGIILDLRAFLRKNDMTVDAAEETLGGKINKFMGEKVAQMSDHTDEAFVTYLEEAEDRCLHSFQDASHDQDISYDARMAVADCLVALNKTHDYMKELKTSMKLAA